MGGGWGGGISGAKRLVRGEGKKVCRIFYLENFVFTSWLIEAFNYSLTVFLIFNIDDCLLADRCRIPHLGSEIHFIDDMVDSHVHIGEQGHMFTTLKVHIECNQS